MNVSTWLTIVLVCCNFGTLAADPVLSVVRSSAGAVPLLLNGDFEQSSDGRFTEWHPAPQGYRPAPAEGREGSALLCENPDAEGWSGASQTLALNRTNTAPIVVRGWSKAEQVTGGADRGYSLYVDILYSDGTPLWGQTADFLCGTHDWQPREMVILPDQPVKTLTLHCMLRGHAGKVWFDDISVAEQQAEGEAVLFQGVPVQLSPVSPRTPEPPLRRHRTDDGLGLVCEQQRIVAVEADGDRLSRLTTAGFLVRDVAANSDFYGFHDGTCPELDLEVAAGFTERANHLLVQGQILDRTGHDRAVTLTFGLPVAADGWHWGDDIRRNRLIRGSGEYVNQVAVGCGATGTLSLYPAAAVWNDRIGLAIGLDMAHPAQYRVGYHAGLQQLFIAYDFGLANGTEKLPCGASFQFVIYRFDPSWGFRAAWQKFMEIFPDHFTVRSKEQGLWMPFTDVSTVPGWEDFGFRYHEGNNNVPWDDAHGVLSFRYTEPMTWWMRMEKGTPRTLTEAKRVRDALAEGEDARQRRLAEVSRVAAMFDSGGQPALLFRDTPWCDGAVWSLNPNPWLTETSPAPSSVEGSLLNAATLHWNDRLKESLYGSESKGRLDGEYLDSLEGYVTANLNFRREHFRFTTVPLTFASDTKQLALFKGLSVFEFTRWMSEDVHRLGKLMFANGVPYRFTFLCPWLDVLGTETDWLRGGQYQPAAIPRMDLWRTLSGRKPYLLLMNTDYDRFTPDLVEKYFQRCLFYGMWPGFFSHNAAENPYWRNPRWYERDRPLFRQYLPHLKRLAEAGWQPVTAARCENENLLVERFGSDAVGTLRFTVFNDTSEPQSGTLSVDDALRGAPRRELIREFTDEPTAPGSTGARVTLAPQQVAVFRLVRR